MYLFCCNFCCEFINLYILTVLPVVGLFRKFLLQNVFSQRSLEVDERQDGLKLSYPKDYVPRANQIQTV